MNPADVNDSSRLILISANSSWNLLNFRMPLIEALQRCGYQVRAAVPLGDQAATLAALDVHFDHVTLDARGTSFLRDARLLFRYIRLMRKLRPFAYLGFTAKPNIYGSIAATICGVPAIPTITGLGTSFLSGSALERIVSCLYFFALRKSPFVFFHNQDDLELFTRRKLVKQAAAKVVRGSGVDLVRFQPSERSAQNAQLTFLFIGRVLQDKGALEFAQAASIVRASKAARFRMVGEVGNHPKAVPYEELAVFAANGTIELFAPVADVRSFIAEADCVVLPSYREGFPRVILEASSMATPVIATNVPGCRQAVDHQVTGLLCEAGSAKSLADAMLAFIGLPRRVRLQMAKAARAKAEAEFSQESVIDAYLAALNSIAT